jgi:hypothetical protein
MYRSRNRRREHRSRLVLETLRDIVATVIVVVTVALLGAGFFAGCHALFTKLDCQTATRNLQFYNRCIASANCTLTAAEMQRVEAYTRMQLARCE